MNIRSIFFLSVIFNAQLVIETCINKENINKYVPVCQTRDEQTYNYAAISTSGVSRNLTVTCTCDVTVYGNTTTHVRYSGPGYPECGISFDIEGVRFTCLDVAKYPLTQFKSTAITFRKTITHDNPDACFQVFTDSSDAEVKVSCYLPSYIPIIHTVPSSPLPTSTLPSTTSGISLTQSEISTTSSMKSDISSTSSTTISTSANATPSTTVQAVTTATKTDYFSSSAGFKTTLAATTSIPTTHYLNTSILPTSGEDEGGSGVTSGTNEESDTVEAPPESNDSTTTMFTTDQSQEAEVDIGETQGPSTSAIIGIAAGGLAGLVITVFVCVTLVHRNKRKPQQEPPVPANSVYIDAFDTEGRVIVDENVYFTGSPVINSSKNSTNNVPKLGQVHHTHAPDSSDIYAIVMKPNRPQSATTESTLVTFKGYSLKPSESPESPSNIPIKGILKRPSVQDMHVKHANGDQQNDANATQSNETNDLKNKKPSSNELSVRVSNKSDDEKSRHVAVIVEDGLPECYHYNPYETIRVEHD